jgi:biopolymer transport protein ExbD
MRYSRNIKVFRGGVDAAPFASLFFLVVLFTMLFYSHVFFPGVPIKLIDEEGPPEMRARSAKIRASGSIEFLGTSYDLSGLKAELQSRGQKGTLPRRVLIETEPQAHAALTIQVENLLKGAGIALKLPGTRLALPDDAGFGGAHNPLVVAGINLNGQIFYQHQLVSEAVLQQKLAAAVAQTPEPLTLLLQADKDLPTGKLTRLSQIASRAGIAQLRIATKPAGG